MSKIITLIFSGIAFAAHDGQDTPMENIQPYLVAAQTPVGTIEFDAAGKPSIVQNAFVAAVAPVPKARHIARVMYVQSTGYNSEVAQTDDSPFITANGTHVRWGIVAANFLPFGTKIKIPDYYGDQVFEVTDRMNKRYWERVDVWFPEHGQAVQWGVRKVKIEILGS